MQPRYFNEDGSVNWKFIERMQLGFVRDKSEAEHEVMVAYALGGKAAVLKLLARRGEIEIIEEDTSLAEAYRAHCEERHRLHSLWARGRRTATAIV